MKKILYFLFSLLILSCTKDDSFTSKDDLSSLSIGLSLNDFQLFVDNGTTSKGELTKKDSDFVNVFFDEVIINFQSVPSGFETDLTINPNDLENSDEVVLPFGTYSWTITNQTTDEISNRLSVYGSGTLDVKEPNISIDLLVETDYSLITVQKKYVSSSILKYGNLTVNMESNDDYYFGYIKSETDGITLEVVDNVYNSTIETVLEDILKCKHYSYLLDYSTIKTQSVSLVCSPMEVIENYLIPNNKDYVEDIEGNKYALKEFCNQVWSTENLKVTKYSDGTEIPQVSDPVEWASLTTGAWSYYDNDPSKGVLYNWYAINGIHDNDPDTPNKSLSPDGWVIPSSSDINTLYNCMIANYHCSATGSNQGNWIGKSMASKYNWVEIESNSISLCTPGYLPEFNNSSGFNLTPSGFRSADGIYENYGIKGLLVTKNQYDEDRTWTRVIGNGGVYLDGWYANPKLNGYPVRIKKI